MNGGRGATTGGSAEGVRFRDGSTRPGYDPGLRHRTSVSPYRFLAGMYILDVYVPWWAIIAILLAAATVVWRRWG